MQVLLAGIRYIFNGANWDPSDPQSIASLFSAHLSITGLTLAISLVIAVPVSLLVARFTQLNLPVQTFAGFLYTIPSLAFLALLVPVTGLTLPTLAIPLIAYTQVVLIRNIVAGIRAVDPALVDVGRAMGMDGSQLQRRVVFPLALPVIIAGVRVATVTTIGIATLGPEVGVDNLGTLIFDGKYLRHYDELMAGVLLVIGLAAGMDLALLGLQRWVGRGQALRAS